MPFTGVASNELLTISGVQESVAAALIELHPKELTLLGWLGDADESAISTKHEWWDDYALPNSIITSTAIASTAGADISIAINGKGLALTIGTVLHNRSANPEYYQVKSIVGADSITLSRGYGGAVAAGSGSLAVGGTLWITAAAGVEGDDHNGRGTRQLGDRRANTVGLFHIPIAISGTNAALMGFNGRNGLDTQRRKGLEQAFFSLEVEVTRGVLNAANSLASATTTRTMKGLKEWITGATGAINSTVTVASFTANAHTYIGDAWGNIINAGASPDSESWGFLAGRDVFRNISNMNDSKIEDVSAVEGFKRVVRTYEGPFGKANVFYSRALDADEMLMVPRERVKVKNLQGRSFNILPIGRQGDNEKELIAGEYTVEVYHPAAMARIRVSG
jgi:hypothetical protein